MYMLWIQLYIWKIVVKIKSAAKKYPDALTQEVLIQTRLGKIGILNNWFVYNIFVYQHLDRGI